MSKLRIISFRIPAEKVDELDRVAEATGSDRSSLLNQAVNDLLDQRRRSRAEAVPHPAPPVQEQPAAPHARAIAAPPPPLQAAPHPAPRADLQPSPPAPHAEFPGRAAIPSRASAQGILSRTILPADAPDSPAPLSAPASAPRPKKGPHGRLLVFLSAKGGSGVTTLACNFAAALASESRQKTLLIDLNLPLGDAAINLGIRPHFSTVSALRNASRLDSIFLCTLLERHPSGLFLLAAPTELSPAQFTVDALDRLLEVARQEFDFVIIDGGSKLDLKHTNSFHESDTIYLVTQVGVPELRNANRLISEFTAVDGPDLDIVINRYDPRSQVITEQSIEKALTKPARWRIPNDYAAVQRMLNSANPLADEDSPVSRTILQMARYVSGRPEPSEEPKNSGLFGWKVSRV